MKLIGTPGMPCASMARWFALAASLVAASTANATNELCEDPLDAGSLPVSARRALGAGELCFINGQVQAVLAADKAVPDFEDMYLVFIHNPAQFMARTIPNIELPGADFDTQLWLFDACGFGLLGNDDFNGPFGPFFSTLLPFSNDGTGIEITEPGLYYIAISGYNNDPLSPGGPIFQQAIPQEISGPDGLGGEQVISAWSGVGEVGFYRIELHGVSFIGETNCPGDLNNDAKINGADFGALLAAWGACGGCPADINGDGLVDGADMGSLLAGWGPCTVIPGVVCGDPASGDCFSSHPNPSCEDPCCCTLICEIDPFCCDVQWDGICANEAQNLCVSQECPTTEGEPCGADTNGGCNTQPTATCCVPSQQPGCGNPSCQDTVCAVDPFCCDVVWDQICANEAIDLCGDYCDAQPQFTPVACGQTICGEAWAQGGIRDTDWFEIVLNSPSGITMQISPTIDMVIGLVNTGGIPDCSLASQLDPFLVVPAGTTDSFTVCLAPGTYWLFAGPNGFDGFPCDADGNPYEVTIDCVFCEE